MTFHWECHHPNCYSLIFFRGVGQPPTSHNLHSQASNSFAVEPALLSVPTTDRIDVRFTPTILSFDCLAFVSSVEEGFGDQMSGDI